MTHMHLTSWIIGILLFIVSLVMLKNKNEKAAKITQMIVRLFYILIFVTGIMLFFKVDANTSYHVKMLAGILVIAVMELIFVAIKKGRSATFYWIYLLLF